MNKHVLYRVYLYLLTIGHLSSVHETCAGIFKQWMGARNRVGIGLSYRAGIFRQSMEAIGTE
jgi:hypothetical protein